MAITPDEAFKKSKPNPEEIGRITQKIDAAIVRQLQTGTRIIIDSHLFGEDWATREAVAAEYIRVGWIVQYHSDQRDGDWYEFSRPTPFQDIRDSRGGNYDH